jgi:hypothetical protein
MTLSRLVLIIIFIISPQTNCEETNQLRERLHLATAPAILTQASNDVIEYSDIMHKV